MVPKKNKVPRIDFLKLKKKGSLYHSLSLTLRVYVKENCEKEESRFSFIISKKITSNTPQRNLLKRRGYSIIKNIIKKTKTCFVCIFYFKKEVLLLHYPELEKEIISLLKKAHVISL